MSHLGELISALIDGELTGVELDRANAHLAACGVCRAEAAELRQLKRDLRMLGEVAGADVLARRLLAMDGPAGGDPVMSRSLRRERGKPGRRRRTRAGTKRPVPYSAQAGVRGARRRRGRYVLWSVVSVMLVGIGTAAFSIGGTGGSSGPQITPPLQVFDVEHSINVGDVPFVDPADEHGPALERVPAEPARP